MDIKITLAIVAISLFAIQHINLTDHEKSTTDNDLTELHRTILNSDDPTEVLEATAAGEQSMSPLCRSGVIASGSDTSPLEGLTYVSYKTGKITYIQIAANNPLYLTQDPFQITTADTLEPSEEISIQLDYYYKNNENCDLVDLYLSRIKNG